VFKYLKNPSVLTHITFRITHNSKKITGSSSDLERGTMPNNVKGFSADRDASIIKSVICA